MYLPSGAGWPQAWPTEWECPPVFITNRTFQFSHMMESPLCGPQAREGLEFKCAGMWLKVRGQKVHFVLWKWLATEGLGLFLLIRCAKGGGIAEWENIIPSSKEQINWWSSQSSLSLLVPTYGVVTMHSTLRGAWGEGRSHMNSVLGVFSQD